MRRSLRSRDNQKERDALSELTNNLHTIQSKKGRKARDSSAEKPIRRGPRRSVSFNEEVREFKYPKNQTMMIRKEDGFQNKKAPSFFVEKTVEPLIEEEEVKEQQVISTIIQNAAKEEPAKEQEDSIEQVDMDITDNITADMSITTKLFDEKDEEDERDQSSNDCFTFSNFTLNTIPITSNLTDNSQTASTSSSGVNCTELYSQPPNTTESIFLNITQYPTKHLKTQEIFNNLNDAKSLLVASIPSAPLDDDDDDDDNNDSAIIENQNDDDDDMINNSDNSDIDMDDNTTNFFQNTLQLSVESPNLHTLDLETIHSRIPQKSHADDTLIIDSDDVDQDATADLLLKGSTICLPSDINMSHNAAGCEGEIVGDVDDDNDDDNNDIKHNSAEKRMTRSRLSILIQENFTNNDDDDEEEDGLQNVQNNSNHAILSTTSPDSLSVEDFLCLTNIHFGNIILGRKNSMIPQKKRPSALQAINKENIDPSGDILAINNTTDKDELDRIMKQRFTEYLRDFLCNQPKYQLLLSTNNSFEAEIQNFQTKISHLSDHLTRNNPTCFSTILQSRSSTSSKSAIQLQTQLKRLKQALKNESKVTWYTKNKDCSLLYQSYALQLLEMLKTHKIKLSNHEFTSSKNNKKNNNNNNEEEKVSNINDMSIDSEISTTEDDEISRKNNEIYVNKLEKKVEKDSDNFQILNGILSWKLTQYRDNKIIFDFPYSYQLTIHLSDTNMNRIKATSFEKTARSPSWQNSFFDTFVVNVKMGEYIKAIKSTKMLPKLIDQLSLWIGRASDLIDEISVLKKNAFLQIELSNSTHCLIVSFNTHNDSKYLPFSLHFDINITSYPFGALNYFISLPEELRDHSIDNGDDDHQLLDKLQHGVDSNQLKEIFLSHSPPQCTFGRIESICCYLSDLLLQPDHRQS